MSKWTEIRDSIEDEMKNAEITEEVKQSVTQKLYDVALPSLQKLGDGFIDAIREQSKSETGWCKLRDSIFLPVVIKSTLWLIELVLSKTIAATTTQTATA